MLRDTDADTESFSVSDLIAVGLTLAALLVIASNVARSFAFTGDSIRDRVYLGSQGAGVGAAFLALGGVAAVLVRSRLGQEGRWDLWAIVGARVVAIAAIGAAIYAVWYLLTLHISIPAPNSVQGLSVSFGGMPWAERLAGIFSALAGGAVGVVTLLAARRPGRGAEPGRATSAATPT